MAGCSELDALQRITPCRFVSFSFPNPLLHHPAAHGAAAEELLRVAVLDSPLPPPPAPLTAAMLVPAGRHRDWIFSTRAGHLHLLLSSLPPPSRLVLLGPPLSSPAPPAISRSPRPDPDAAAHALLLPLLLAVSPVAAFRGGAGGLPDVPMASFEDDLIRIVPVRTAVGPVAGEMLVEDVAADCSPGPPEFRRRLRFKRMPCLVQTQVRLVAPSPSAVLEEGSSGSFRPEVGGSLVEPYLRAMVAGLALVAAAVDERARSGIRPRCLCAGVGGGALLMSLRMQLGFDVLGVEADSVVLDVARNDFGLVEDEFLRVRVGDAIQLMLDFARRADSGMGFDAVMVDLDSSDAMHGVSAPPLEMSQASVLLAACSILRCDGVLVLNVIPPPSDGSFYKGLIDVLRGVFAELYELDVGNGENFILIATASPVETTPGSSTGSFLMELRKLAETSLIEQIKKI